MKINILSTKPKNCGIGITNQYLVDGMQPYLKENNIQINRIYIDKPFSKNTLYFIWLAVKSGRKCDLIHVHYNHDCFGQIGRFYGFQNIFVYPILKLSRRPIVTTFHEHPNLSNFNKFKKLFYRILNWAPLKLSDVILVTTNKAKSILVNQGISGHRLNIIPHGSFKKVNKIPKKAAKERLGLQRKRIITLFGFIDTNKGHHLILDILRDLPDSYHFLIAGDVRSKKGGRYMEHLLDLIEEYNLIDRVTFFGYVHKKDFPLVMSATDILVCPYSDITSSLALTTAISYMKPILTSDIEPFKLFYENHKCTRIFRLNDRNDLLLNIKNITRFRTVKKRLYSRMQKFVKDFNWNEIGKEQINMYKVAYNLK